MSGKLRRYNQIPLWRQLLQVRTIVVPNLIDSCKIVAGTLQSIYKLIKWRPDVVFAKGGYVCLPVGLAAAVFRIPLVIHDSDTHPGLTNRILARFAHTIATGAPLKYYQYPAKKSYYTGIPIDSSLAPYSHTKQIDAKKKIGVSATQPLIVITGGGLGAQRLNSTVLKVQDDLCKLGSVLLISGAGQYERATTAVAAHNAADFKVEGFFSVHELHEVLGAADIVVSRAGATTLLELAALAKPTVLVPNAQLTGGHQLKNARMYEDSGATVVLDESELEATPLLLVDTLGSLLHNPSRMKALSAAIHAHARPDAAKKVAELILRAASKRRLVQ